MSTCFLCGCPAPLSCPSCPLTSCSPGHLSLHRPASSCLPFSPSSIPGVGRTLVASRALQPGDLVLSEQPVVVGPTQQARPLCLCCLLPADLSCLCPTCGFPFCSPQCLDRGGEQHAAECAVLSRAPPPHLGPGSPANHVLLPLRLLLWYEQHPEEAELVQRLMTHAEEKAGRDYWPVAQLHVVDFLLEKCGESRWSRQQVTDAVTLLEVNGFEIESYNPGGFRGLYPYVASLTSHSCRPNCHSIVQASPPYTNRLVASRLIEQGEELTTTYISLTAGTRTRRSLLKEGWCFSCTCPRCQDPAELGAHTSSLCCKACKQGVLLPAAPLETSCHWVCGCGNTMPGEEVSRLVDCFMANIRKLSVENRYNLKTWTDLLKCCGPIFHPQHEVMCELAKWLLPILARNSGMEAPSLPLVRQKLALASSYLRVLDLVVGHVSKTRAKAIFELADSALVAAIQDFQEDRIDDCVLKQKLTVNKEKIAEALQIFEILGIETNFEKMIAISLKKMRAQSEDMIRDLIENE